MFYKKGGKNMLAELLVRAELKKAKRTPRHAERKKRKSISERFFPDLDARHMQWDKKYLLSR